MNQKTDEEIVCEAQKGAAESFGVLVERYEAKMHRYGRKFLSSNEDIKDLVQDIFIKAYVNILSFDLKKKFSSWLYRIAHNEFVNAIKKKSRMPLFLFDLDAFLPQIFAGETADSRVNDLDAKKMLDKCLSEIDFKYREALVLYYFEERSYQEISEILYLPVSTVGVRLNRGKIILKKIFKEKYPNYE